MSPASPERLSSIAAAAGVTLPASAKLVFEDTSTRGANTESAGLWIVAVPGSSALVLPGDRVTVPAATVRANIVSNVPDLAIGTNSGPDAFVNDWTRATSRWRGTTLTTDNGIYLLLERSKL